MICAACHKAKRPSAVFFTRGILLGCIACGSGPVEVLGNRHFEDQGQLFTLEQAYQRHAAGLPVHLALGVVRYDTEGILRVQDNGER